MMMGVRMEGWGGVEEVSLVLWWVGDKEMMVLGGNVDVVWLLVGGVEMGSGRGFEGLFLREMLIILVREWIESRRYMLVGLELEEIMDLENYGLQKGGRRIFGWTGAV